MLSCSKTYKDIPFAHRQPFHPGNCSKIHGHNWSITIEFIAQKLDKNGFVDFGKLKYLKKFINEKLDHACLFSKDDSKVKSLSESIHKDLFKIIWVENSSCEGIAKYLYFNFSKLLKENEGDRVSIRSICLHEDGKNAVLYCP